MGDKRHLCFRCGRKRVLSKLEMCTCAKTYWCKEGCFLLERKQWKKWENNHKRKIIVVI